MQELSSNNFEKQLNSNYMNIEQQTDLFSDGFHLSKSVSSVPDMYKCETESIASSVTSKHRIDMLFNDARSVTSEYHISYKYHEPRKVKSLIEGAEDDSYYAEPTVKNDVQVRIEKMFSEVSSSEQETETSCSVSKKFVVEHLGSMPVHDKITSVDGLQEPLKELYFKYRMQKKKNQLGIIQISDRGLQVEYNSNYGGKIEKLIPGLNIASWASVKFSYRSSNENYEYAFVPIVANSTTNSLYRPLEEKFLEYITEADNLSLFVVVMREPDAPKKQLICQGFVCNSSEDAIIMATTLYKIIINLKSKHRIMKSKIQKRHLRQSSNRLSSIGETSANEMVESECGKYASVEKSPTPPPPTRPPRKVKETTKFQNTENIAVNRECNKSSEIGDVLTKIAIPRSSSFLNTNRICSRYSDTNPIEPIPKTTFSPLGFVEMFNELQTQEGLKTIDEILNVIIKADGMSFNELKPIYKEFLMKLALVLSKDELYHRSKSIMKSQKKRKTPNLKKVITTKKGLKNVFRKSLVKLKTNKSKSCSCVKSDSKFYNDGTSTDSFFLTDKPPKLDAKLRPTKNFNARHKTFRFRSQRITSTSEDSDYPNVNQRKFKNKIKEDALRPSSSGYFSFSECSYDTESCTCTSADKCYCSLNKNKQIKKSKTNYTDCECDTMLCRKRNKCYCTKSNKLSLVEQLKRKGFAISESSLSPDDTNKKNLVKEKSHTKLSKSLEYLENAKKYKNRMELYDTEQKAFPCRHSYKYSTSFSSDSSRTSQKRSVSSDNLAVDYSLFAKSDERAAKNNTHLLKSSKRIPNKQNVIYAELACPKLIQESQFDTNYTVPSILSPIQMEMPSVLTICPYTSVRTCNCTCTCPLYTKESFPRFKSEYGYSSTPFHRMNMENFFGYYP
ncbi:hypothetical protein PGB90_004422 [Kerria lacca]